MCPLLFFNGPLLTVLLTSLGLSFQSEINFVTFILINLIFIRINVSIHEEQIIVLFSTSSLGHSRPFFQLFRIVSIFSVDLHIEQSRYKTVSLTVTINHKSVTRLLICFFRIFYRTWAAFFQVKTDEPSRSERLILILF